MFASEPRIADLSDEAIEALPQGPAVFVIARHDAPPYVGRTAMLRRRMKRMLRIRGLRESATCIEYWLCASRLESSAVLYEIASRVFPDTYVEFLKLRFPPYVRLITAAAFPRTQITSRLAGTGVYYGPFRTRASAEIFERQMLDLFQLRRCQEELHPSPDHPGCIYGEMSMCLRPCQEQVGAAEYATESARVAEFLHTGGVVALHAAESSRDRLSTEMDFEAAARQHKRAEKIQEVLKNRDDLARAVDSQHGIAITAGHEPDSVLLWIMTCGWWESPVPFSVGATHSVSMDQRLREIIASVARDGGTPLERQEHLALLARWYYSSWRDGAWIPFESMNRIPYRKVVGAISRTVHQNSPATSQ